eukprot:TRINITY_DN4261_c0_g6_i1.p2 TRINITY_DN4261_c0_g6~~TRINITY_DN4261_c0_g6_i1.p2  ORF type:complete len:174 (-),score=42.46 TRINITY_DN4261_c0_g6_i1:538-1059(-)
MKLAQNISLTAEDWRRNDQYCGAITILQVAYGITPQKLKEYRNDESSLRTEVIDQIPNDYPDIGLQLMETITMMIQGEDIDMIAQAYDKSDPVLCHKDFGVMRNKQVEDDVIEILKPKISNDEISKTIAHITKGVNLNFVKKSLKSPPKSEDIRDLVQKTITSEQQKLKCDAW